MSGPPLDSAVVDRAVLLAVAAGLLTAVSSTCQRLGAAQAPGDDSFSPTLILRLVRDRLWLAGVASMILGFLCQAAALHLGSLALVQPILASEMLFVFAFVAILSPRRVRGRDLAAAVAMAAGLGVFLFAADPHGGRAHAPATLWLLAAAAGTGLVVLLVLAAFLTPSRRRLARSSPSRRAALLGAATGVSWGYLAAVIKELTAHTGHGVAGLLATWSPYVLVAVGIASMILSTNALRAGPLAASQPGFTIVDPLVASLLGVFIFRDRIDLSPGAATLEILAASVLVCGVLALSRSSLVHEVPLPEGPGARTDAPTTRSGCPDGQDVAADR
jgi:drug/metabolite transporter (DMT)-like permease